MPSRLLKLFICLLCLAGIVLQAHAQPVRPPERETGGVVPGRPGGLRTAGTEEAPQAPAMPEEAVPETPEIPAAPEEAPAEAGEEGVAPEVTSDVEGPLTEEEKVYLNVHDADITDVIKQISKATARNFIIDDKIKGKITIISERPMTREEAYQTFLSALEVAGYTTVKGPANVIKVVALKEAAHSPIPTHVDSTPYTDSFVTRLISLDNISALDMSNAIKDLVSRDGNLFAYPATNTLIVTDSGSNIDRIMKIVKELDQEGPQQVMEIIPIRNALATDIAKMVQELFEEEKSQAAAGRRGRKGAQPEELEEVSRIIPDERTNSIIVLASKRAIENVRNIVKMLDATLSGAEEGRIHVYYLKHAKAKEMAETLSALTAAAAAGSKQAQKGGGTDIAVAKFEGGIKITADESTNALIITALPKDFQTLIDRVISKLDIPRRQVYFEAVVMEISLSKGSEYGVSGFGGAGVGGSMIGMGATMGGPSLLGSILGGAATGGTGAWPGILGGLISSRTTNMTYIAPDGTSSTLTMPAFSAFLSALATRGEANLVATPNLLTLDNEEATMSVLSKEPTPGSTTFTSAATTATSVDYKEAGLELKIKPQITEGDMVLLEIEQKLSGFTQPKYSTNLNAPAMKERSIKTTVVTENGQTVVLAGLMDDQSSKSKRKIPLLGDIPILGILFSTTTTSMSKNNLLIFITPHVIKDRTDFTAIVRRKIEERNRFIDENFSKSRRTQIRNTIQTHRDDLLEFREPIELEPAAPGVTTAPKTTKTQPRYTPQYQVPPPVAAPQPVVTAPSVESSTWRPVTPPAYTPPPAPPPPSTSMKEEVKPLPPPPPETSLETAPPQKKKKKKPVIEPPAAEEKKEEAAKLPEWVPSPEKTEEVKTEEAPKEEEAPPPEEKKKWKKPAPGSRNGEVDLAY